MRGGYQVVSRLSTCLDEIKIEALVAQRAASRQERDRAFAEIARLAETSADLVARAVGDQAAPGAMR